MVNLTIEQREQKKKSTVQHVIYALEFLRHKIKSATVVERNAGITFRFTEFANYMIENSPEFVKDRESMRNATGQPFPKSYYLNSRRVCIEHILNQLIILKYISMRGLVPSTRNPEVSVMLYNIDVWDIPS
jgi:hypothetical protein